MHKISLKNEEVIMDLSSKDLERLTKLQSTLSFINDNLKDMKTLKALEILINMQKDRDSIDIDYDKVIEYLVKVIGKGSNLDNYVFNKKKEEVDIIDEEDEDILSDILSKEEIADMFNTVKKKERG